MTPTAGNSAPQIIRKRTGIMLAQAGAMFRVAMPRKDAKGNALPAAPSVVLTVQEARAGHGKALRACCLTCAGGVVEASTLAELEALHPSDSVMDRQEEAHVFAMTDGVAVYTAEPRR
jgi:hypothetical protein